MYVIKQIRIPGLTRLKVDLSIDDLQAFRSECARTYKVKASQVRFVYEER